MVDTNDYRDDYEDKEETVRENDGGWTWQQVQVPLSGIRDSTAEMVFSNPCNQHGDDSDDRIVPAYSECSIRFTKKMFELNRDKPITAYVNTPSKVNSF